MILTQWIDQIGDWNPQLFRELKGRLTLKSLGLVGLISVVIQTLIYLNFLSSLPYPQAVNHRYCIGTAPAGFDSNSYLFTNQNFCIADAFGNFTLNWQLWWLDIFFTLIFTSFFIVLLGGAYLLIQDLGKEDQVGTLNFVKLSPQSATAIAIGKILGVPCLVYSGGILLVLPFQLWAGINGGIPLHLLLVSYLVMGAGCLFFYSLAMLYSLVSKGSPAMKAWLATGALFYVMSMTTLMVLNESTHLGNLMDGILLLNPLHILFYLAQATSVADDLSLFHYNSLTDVSFFRVYLWRQVVIATVSYFVIYGISLYWIAASFKRRFHSINRTLLSKQQSYILTALLTVFSVGFTLQEPLNFSTEYNNWLFSFGMMTVMATIYLLSLMSVLSPSYQSIQDWSRYQHHSAAEWLLGERSPAFWAVVVNSGIVFSGLAIAALVVMEAKYVLSFILGLLLQLSILSLLAIMVQRALLSKGKRRGVAATVLVALGVVLPLMFMAINAVDPSLDPAPWLWTILPIVATRDAALSTVLLTLLAQLTAIATLHQLVQHRLKQIGTSELQQLLAAET